VVLAADAQATIAALQARAEQAERLVASQAQEIIQRRQTLGDLAHLHQEQSKQLTQRTAELEAAKAIQAIDLKNNNAYREQVATLQAELERVRGERDHAKKMEAVQKEVADNQTWHVQKLRTLIAALPKVEGEILEQGDFAFVRYAHADGPLPEIPRCNQIALLQHRQRVHTVKRKITLF
jgi:hypothetical protein